MPDLDKYDIYYLGRKIDDIFDYEYEIYSTTDKGFGYMTIYYINYDGRIDSVSGGISSFKFVKKENYYEKFKNIYK